MTTLREAAQQALEALEQSETTVPYEGFGMTRRKAERKHQAAIAALRAALAEPQEPAIQCTYPLCKTTAGCSGVCSKVARAIEAAVWGEKA